jgi:hypothetical protein
MTKDNYYLAIDIIKQNNIKNNKSHLTKEQYELIVDLINSCDDDIFHWDIERTMLVYPRLHAYLLDCEMYYGFTKNEIKSFVLGLNELGFTCDYIDLAIKPHNIFTHTFKPYNLRVL